MPIHIVVTTHTPRHLAACLAALARQRVTPETIVVTCDVVDPAIDETVRSAARSTEAPVILVRRGHHGVSRQAQVRNNGVRALIEHAAPRDEHLVLFIDGDIVLGPEAVTRHAALAAGGADLVLGFRAELGEEATRSFAGEAFDFDACWPAGADADLAGRAARYRRSLRLASLGARRAGLVKPHKPKVISCHAGLRLGLFRAINGFDESFEGHGFEDDDLGLRAYMVRPSPRVVVAVDLVRALHLWHPSRAAPAPRRTPQARHFARPRKTFRADRGLDQPRPQHDVAVTVLPGASGRLP